MRIKQSGFTLVELLVVFAILGILIAILLPAVQAARNAARRTTCSNNLRQIGLAFQMHHNQYQVFPTGGDDGPDDCCIATTPDYFCWTYHILPFIEQQQVYDLPEVQLKKTPVGTYYCPSRRTVRLYRDQAKSDYAANGGSEQLPGVVVPISRFPKVSLKHITDGSSNTLMLGETRVHALHMDAPLKGYYSDNENCYTNGWADEVVKRSLPIGDTYFVPGPDVYDSSQHGRVVHGQFGSSHAAGMNAILCDGSGRMLSYDVDAILFRRLCERSDGQSVDLNEL